MPYFRKVEADALDKYNIVAGIDEVGRGSFAGPLVVGVVVYNDYLQKIRGLNDSKKIAKSKRNDLAFKIAGNTDFGLGICWPFEIDKIGMSACLKLAINRSLKCLSAKPDYLFLDGYLKPDFDIDYENIVKGDSKVRSIAAASIVAKVYRDNLMNCYCSVYNEFDWAAHVGYGTRKHRELILSKGCTPIHRKSFLRNLLDENTTSR